MPTISGLGFSVQDRPNATTN